MASLTSTQRSVPVPPVPELQVLATAEWPPGEVATPLPGFVYSAFSPTVAALAERCLTAWGATAPLPATTGAGTALILASVRGDLAIARAIADTVDSGRRMSPLLFFQSVANAVLGHVAARWGLGGPVVCVSPVADAATDALDLARSLLADGDADAALVLVVEPAWSAGEYDRGDAWLVRLAERPFPDPAAQGE